MEYIEYMPGAIAAVALLVRIGMAMNDSRLQKNRNNPRKKPSAA